MRPGTGPGPPASRGMAPSPGPDTARAGTREAATRRQ